jgi:hypothetical protein
MRFAAPCGDAVQLFEADLLGNIGLFADNGWLSRPVLDECGTFGRSQERAVRRLEFNHLDMLAERLRQALSMLQ